MPPIEESDNLRREMDKEQREFLNKLVFDISGQQKQLNEKLTEHHIIMQRIENSLEGINDLIHKHEKVLYGVPGDDNSTGILVQLANLRNDIKSIVSDTAKNYALGVSLGVVLLSEGFRYFISILHK